MNIKLFNECSSLSIARIAPSMYHAFTAFLWHTSYSVSILRPPHFCTSAFSFLDTVISEQLKNATQNSSLAGSFSPLTSAAQLNISVFLLKEKHTAHFCAHTSLAELSHKQLTECWNTRQALTSSISVFPVVLIFSYVFVLIHLQIPSVMA